MYSSGKINSKKTEKSESRRKRQTGFTFAEVLAAMVFVAIVVPTALHGIALASRAETIADRKTNASMLAERTLREIVLMEQWKSGQTQGDYGTDWPGYHWKLLSETWQRDSMRLITIFVFFDVQDREYDVRLSTLVDESEETTETTTTSPTTETTGS
jgi:Tfp pilus assembly protein PilV